MAKYQQYAKYKDSGVEWLGEVPEHWGLPKLIHQTSRIGDGLHSTPQYQDKTGYYFINGNNLVDGYIVVGETSKEVPEEAYKKHYIHLDKSSVLLSINGTIGNVARYNNERVILGKSAAYMNCSDDLLPEYLMLYLQSSQALYYFNLEVTGTTIFNLSLNSIRQMKVCLPAKQEQTQIANFLDHETAQIDTLIEKQQTLIQLLKEKRQAVISHAVTKGLNPDAPMKDSGVEWLGEVPAHWRSGALKYWADIIDCKHITAEFVQEGYPLASISEVKGWEVNLSTSKFTTKKFYLELIENGRKPTIGDILYSRNATVGEAALVITGMSDFAMGQDICLIRPNNNILPEYILYVLNSGVIKNQLDLAMVGSTFKRINVDDIRNFDIAFPSLPEQQEIIDWLKVILNKYDALTDNAEQAIQLMQERRTALISAAVTGKIDVRGWVAP